jgi:hypothetical protein
VPGEYSLKRFSPTIGEIYRIDFGEAGAVELELVEATAVPGGENAEPPPFTMQFRGPAEPVLAQATYQLSHSTLGTLDIFVVPTAADADGASYEAVFA